MQIKDPTPRKTTLRLHLLLRDVAQVRELANPSKRTGKRVKAHRIEIHRPPNLHLQILRPKAALLHSTQAKEHRPKLELVRDQFRTRKAMTTINLPRQRKPINLSKLPKLTHPLLRDKIFQRRTENHVRSQEPSPNRLPKTSRITDVDLMSTPSERFSKII